MAIETLGAALRQINRLFAEGVVAGLSDTELLERFVTRGDAGAFEALVGRHGPMVLSVCRGTLRDPHDAEDAFQATFLVLVQKGGTIRGRGALAGWLHQVAHRVAIQANIAAARRRTREREVEQMAVATPMNAPAASDDLLSALHEEIARLPEKYRLAVVHCDLEGMTQAQAAGQLHWSRRTLQHRLAEGRARLKRRLARRGLAPDGATVGAMLLREARAAVPSAWNEATVRAAVAATNHAVTVGVVSAAAQQLAREVFKVMLLRKFTWASATLLAAGLIGWGASAAWVSLGQGAPKGATAPSAPAVRPTADPAVPQPKPSSADMAGTFPARGRVLDPDGKPVAGAGVYVRHYAENRGSVIDPMAARQKGRVAVTDADGRFHFEIDKGASDGSYYSGVTGWHKAQIAVAAPGFAPAWVEAGDLVKRGEMALRLVRDDVPVRGRVLDSQGRPVAGVAVRIRAIWEVKDGVDSDAMLASGAVDENMSQMARRYGNVLGPAAPTWQADPTPLWPGGRNAWTTGADGRFEVRGIGRDRVARLEFHGGGVADGTLDVMARPAKAPPKARPRPSMLRGAALKGREAAFHGYYPQGTQLVGATFDYIASPTKPIAGVVRLKGSSKPVVGAIVRAADAGTHTDVTARTDAEGRFRLDGVPKGEFYQIGVNPRQGIDPFLGRWEIIDDTEGLKPIEAAIEVPPGVIVTGRLVDKATGRTVPPADVEYTKAPDNVATGDARAFSRLADAAFGLTVPPGRGMIAGAAAVEGKDDPYVGARLKAADRKKASDDNSYTFRLVGFHTYRFINVPAGSGPVTVDLELTHGLSRAGRLTGPDGLPVVGADAYGLSAREWSGTGNSRALDADTFEVGGLEPGHPRLVVFTHKARKLVGAAVLKDEDLKSTTPLEVKLVPAGAITGRLVDDDGLPWAGATLDVNMFDPDRPPGFACFFGKTVTADAQGRFQVEPFVPDVETEVFIAVRNRAGGLLDGGNALRKPILKPGEVRDLGDVKAKKIAQ
jgi:RNA polymerase sigma factor (sigma-70 family)